MPHPDERYLDALDRVLDGDEADDGLDPATRETIQQLRLLARSASPQPVRLAPVGSGLVARAAIMDDPRSTARSYPRWSLASAAAIMLVIALLAAFLSGGWNSRSRTSEMAASQTFVEPPENCVEADRNKPYPSSYEAGSAIPGPRLRRATTSVPMYNIDVMKMSQLPEGGEVSRDEIIALTAAITERVACRNAGALGWTNLTDEVALSGLSTGGSSFFPNEPVRLDYRRYIPSTYVPNALDYRALAPGLVGVSLQVDIAGYGTGEFDVFKESNGVWTLVDSVYTGTDAWVDGLSPANIPVEREILLLDDRISPNTTFLRADTEVTIRVTNRGGQTRALSIGPFGNTGNLSPGESTYITFVAHAGQYDIALTDPETNTPIVFRILIVKPQESIATPVS